MPRRSTSPRPAGGDGFDRRVFIDVIAVIALVGTPAVLVLAAVLHRPYVLIALALVIPALAAVPVAFERRHRARHDPGPAVTAPRRGVGPAPVPAGAGPAERPRRSDVTGTEGGRTGVRRRSEQLRVDGGGIRAVEDGHRR